MILDENDVTEVGDVYFDPRLPPSRLSSNAGKTVAEIRIYDPSTFGNNVIGRPPISKNDIEYLKYMDMVLSGGYKYDIVR
jgi:hypothetical protein